MGATAPGRGARAFMIGALIFDLDNCLAPATEVGEALYEPAFAAMRAASRGVFPEARLARAFADCWRHPLDWVAARHGFTPEMLAAGWREFARLEVTRPMCGYGDLEVLGGLPKPRFLVTSGFRRLQESKIRALGLARWFNALHVDAIDEPGRTGKEGFFSNIAAAHRLDPAGVLVVGDSAESELAAGKRLGMPTAQILRPGVPRAPDATHHVKSLEELRELIARANA